MVYVCLCAFRASVLWAQSVTRGMGSEVGGDTHDAAAAARGERLPRVLFVSVNPFSQTSSNGKTFASFFEGYPAESIAQLYFHRETPSSPVCQNYFRITDQDLLRDIVRPWRVTGERVANGSRSSLRYNGRAHEALTHSWTARLLRQLLWTQVRLDNRKLLDWLEAFDPEVVLFCGGDAAALYSKVTSLADRFGAKITFYITDDYVLPISSDNVAARALRLWTRYVFRRLTSRADLVLTIGELMSKRYKDEFGFDSVAVMNMVDVPDVRPESCSAATVQGAQLTLVYAGSLHSNRWKVLAKMTESIERLSGKDVQVRLRIYGPEPPREALPLIDRPPFAVYGGLLSADEIALVITDADVLVHVEADDPESMAATALSVSTKIPEYLASGTSILAVGPRGLASIEYLSAHDVATIIEPHDVAGLDNAIESLALHPEVRNELGRRAFDLALSNHGGDRTRRMLWERLTRLAQ